jgi:imidazolonepropionase-like amidohydrolase
VKSFACVVGLLVAALIAPAADFLPPGQRPLPHGVHALVGGRIVVKPGNALENGTILVRDGLITAVGVGLAAPADARVWDMKGATIYAGFIDAYLALGDTNPPVSVADGVPVLDAPASGAAPFRGVVGDQTDRGERGPGYDVPLITPQRRMFEGHSPSARELSGMRDLGFTTANIVPARGILRGTSTLVNLREANPNEVVLRADVFQHVAFETGRGREGEFPAALMGVIAAVRQSFFDARHYAFAHAAYAANPAGGQRPEFNPALEALRAPIYEKQPVVFEPGSVLMADRAARVAQELGVEYLLTASGQEWRRPDLVKATGARFIVPLNLPAIPRLPRDDDWADIDLDRLRAWDWAAENPAVLRRAGLEIALTTYSLTPRSNFRRNLRAAIDRGLTEEDALAALTTAPAKFCGVADRLGTIEAGKIANLTVVDGNYFDPDKKVREVWIDGQVQRVEIAPVRLAETKAAPKATTAAPKKDSTAKKTSEAEKKAASATKSRAEQARELMRPRTARAPFEGRGPLATPHAVLIRHATVWTCGPDGRLTKADVLVRDGKIEAVGRDLNVPGDLGSKTLILEGEGRHVTPGLIDCHSHTAILGGVNEATLPSSAMVRVGDVVNSETPTLYEQLAGGLTTANLLHGSANPIGGQNAVIKLRDGAGPEELKLEGAPPGIKFALGENVKQANSERNRTRFPQTRMGVETFFENRFEAARQYLAAWAAHRAKGGLAPRRDLELEALGEILEGQRLVHCHSYRQDEILAFLRVCERFGVKIATLQHILEGYKVADEIAQHGAGASAFSDWWAYKFEVIDAIPYAGSLMRERGVLVSFNSDSSDLARRMNLEAAKAVKYGGTPEEEALKFVTINPAKQLRVDQRIGSLEAGKDADFVIWSGSPLDSGAVCLETWIDGKKYFDRSQSAARAAEPAKERESLVAKAKKYLELTAPPRTGGAPATTTPAQAAFFARALEQMHSITECGECALRRELQ